MRTARCLQKLRLLFQRFRTGLFLCFLEGSLEEAFFLCGGLGRFAVEPFYACDINAADNGFYFFLYGNGIKDFFVADKRHNLGTNLGFHNRKSVV